METTDLVVGVNAVSRCMERMAAGGAEAAEEDEEGIKLVLICRDLAGAPGSAGSDGRAAVQPAGGNGHSLALIAHIPPLAAAAGVTICCLGAKDLHPKRCRRAFLAFSRYHRMLTRVAGRAGVRGLGRPVSSADLGAALGLRRAVCVGVRRPYGGASSGPASKLLAFLEQVRISFRPPHACTLCIPQSIPGG